MGWFDFINKGKTLATSEVQDYEKLFNKKIPRETPVSDLDFTFLDTETTGLNSRRDHIVSYGSVKAKGYTIKIKSVKEYYLNPGKLGREAIKVHGIIKTEGFIPLEDFVRRFLLDIGDSILVAHHAGFDRAMLERACRPFGLKKLNNPVIDTLDLAIRLEIGRNYNSRLINMQDYSLDSLCGRYHIPLDDRHTASGDALLTAQLWMKLLKIAESKGIKTFGDLMKR